MFPYAPDFLLFLCASIAIDIGVGAALLSLPLGKVGPVDWNNRITLPRCLFALAIVACIWAPKCLLGYFIGVGFFGWMAMATFTAAVAAPALGILTLGVPYFRSRMTRGAKILAGASLVAIPIALYALVLEPGRVVFEKATVPIAGVKDPITIVVLADIQCSAITAREREIAERVNALNPDLILMPGDLWQERGTLQPQGLDLASPIAQEFRAFLRSLRASSGVFFCPGDAEEHYDWRGLIEGTGVQILDNTIARVNVRGREVVIAGTELDMHAEGARSIVFALENEPRNRPLTILMSHRPDIMLLPYARSEAASTGKPITEFSERFDRVDLLVCGHTHGGQVRVPGIGPLVTFSDVPSKIATGGLSALDDDTWIYVSRGIGIERIQAPRIRFLCPPEVSVLTIRDSAAK